MKKNTYDIPIISVENISKSFNNKIAVDNLSFSIPKSSMFAFLGQNGAGKSTTINMLIGLISKDSGKVFYDGQEHFLTFKNQIGVVFQNNIFDDLLTVEENLMLYGTLHLKDKKIIKSRYDEIVALLSLEDFTKKRFQLLSGGQKRKSEIARALFTSPRVLFLDEPTTGLDPKTRIDVWNILHKLRRETDMTIFLTTHYMEETADADKVVIIHKGKHICEGSPSELKAKYSFDRLLITPKNDVKFEQTLQEKAIDFTKNADIYSIPTDKTLDSIKLLYSLKSNIHYYEVKKGTMDDVFLNAVGEDIKMEEQNG